MKEERIFGELFNNPNIIDEKELVSVAETDSQFIEENDGDMVFINVLDPLFSIGGIVHPNKNNGEYYRLDATKKEIYSSANSSLAHCTAGAQVRFCTDADSVKIKIKLRFALTGMNHFTNRGVYGIDAYIGTGNNRHYVGAQMQTFADSSSYNEGVLNLPKGINEVLINLPLYGGVSKLVVGFPVNSKTVKPLNRTIEKPIAFYGSSITQGGCVSRPGNMYSNILCRALDADCMNLGFSGSAMGEQSIAEYIGSRKISAFVMDYDYNSPTADSLMETHSAFFKTVRKAHPEIPVIMVTHPYYAAVTEGDIKRKNIIIATYEAALADGDRNVYFVDSEDFFPLEMRDLYAVDNLHPNDLGQFMMAKAIYPFLRKTL
ncbi:MAG: hypothetical protein A2Y15_05725 [Clostridiales bacterium GWF2_36_10]|nr:MAG: hypothetical protein A2Y15_05725 [Clostridiales bacterium GWF2_36_10]HAN21958.1 hypothetical protein [Clostridiales bacterium]